jgi:hypothetical protein
MEKNYIFTIRRTLLVLIFSISLFTKGQTVQIHQVDFESALDTWTLAGTNTTRNGGSAYKNANKLSIAVNGSTAVSPIIPTLIYNKIDVDLFIRSNDAPTSSTITLQYRDNPLASWQNVRVVTKGDGATFRDINNNTAYYYVSATLLNTSFIFSLTSEFRLVTSSSSDAVEFYVDYITIFGTTYKSITTAPGGITSGLDLWLRSDKVDGSTVAADNADVNTWIDFGRGNNAKVSDATNINIARPKFKNNAADNLNFNPMVSFVNNTLTAPKEVSYMNPNRQFLYGTSGFHTNDFFIVVVADPSISSATSPPMDVFTSQRTISNAYDEDVTGIGFGNYSARFNNEVIAYALGTNPQPTPSDVNLRGYGIAEVSGNSYSKIGILNARNKISGTQELYLNGLNIGNTEVGVPQFSNENNRRFWLGRSQAFDGSFNGKIAEVISYSSRKNDATERIRIESYLAIKYGITLGVNGVSQNYQDSNAAVIWNATANSGFNFDIAGIGRDDASQLNQKQSRSQNNGVNAPVLTMGLGNIAITNSANANTFPTNRSFLIWGSNGQNMNDSGVPISLNFGPATVSTLTSVANRKWQVVETGGNVPAVKVQVPTAALTNFTPLVGNDAYVMVVADDAAFTIGIETVFLLTNGANQETLFDFDGTKYITFGVAHETVAPRHLTFDGNDDFVRMDYAPDLSSNFTVMAWIRNTGSNNPASDQAIIAKSNGTTGFTLYDRTNNRIRMEWTDSGLVNNVLTGTTQIPPNEWHHIAIIYTGGVARLYIDGVQDATANLNPPATTSHTFSIGAQFRSQTDIRHPFKGDIEEVRIWDTALTVDQIRFVMNQEILQDVAGTRGVIIPNTITKNDLAGLNWNRLTAYYTMNSYIGTHINDDSQNNQRGRLIVPDKVAVMQQNAPLPYESAAAGSWSSNATWQNGTNMQVPYDACIVDGVTRVAWNIVRTNHNISSNSDKVVLGLMVDSNILTANNDTKLEVSHYLKIDGKIDLEGRSQLIQTLNSDLDPASSGILERDQQGTVDIYKYNYWSSPVGTPNSTTNNNNYSLNGVLRDGTNPAAPANINWTAALDGIPGPPIRISTRWTYKFENAGNDIANWVAIGSTGTVKAGQGYIHKGSGAASATQNYTFQGKPHNGRIQFNTPGNMLNLFGNPYASALDASAFLTTNLAATDGALYFWEHWGGGTHRLLDYQGGYATRNLTTGVPAISHPDVSQTGSGSITPGRYIPVGQGFFVIASSAGGTITFDNNQRAFVKESDANSNIHFRANNRNDLNAFGTQTQQFPENNQSVSSEEKITLLRLGYFTANGFKRQVALGFINNKATDGFDKGYDALNIDEQPDDMYFVLDNQKLVIQGVGAFDESKQFPIGLVCQSHGKVKFMFDGAENLDENTPVFLFDKQTNTYYNLKENVAEIEITSSGTFNDRFRIQFTQNTLSSGDFETIDERISIFYLNADHTLNILNTRSDVEISSVQLYDLLGRLIESIELENPSKGEIKIRLNEKHAQSVYIAKLKTTNGDSISKKIVITN